MGAPRCGGRTHRFAGLRRRIALLTLPVVVIAVFALPSGTASSAEGPTIEAASSGYGFVWKPPSAEVSAGGTVTFTSPSASVPHGVTWKSGPETPSCNGVPIDEGRSSWSGSCAFAQPGAYAFVCYVHPVEMKGTITVSSLSVDGTPTNPPPEGSPESPLAGKASRALKLAKSQRGSSVRGSIALSQASAGGRLEIGLLARRAALLGAGRSGTMRVGRLVRSHLKAGRVTFTVSLKRLARRALRRNGRLPLTVTVIVSTLHRDALKLRRRVVLHV